MRPASALSRRSRRRDRKSTRLNSSHPSSSYAVFCLKKKIPVAYRARGGQFIQPEPLAQAPLPRDLTYHRRRCRSLTAPPLTHPHHGLTFFFIDTATPEIYTLSLHDALPICPGIALLSPWIVPGLGPAVAEITGRAGAGVVDPLGEAGSWLARFVACAAALIVFTGLLLLLRRLLLARREVREAETWGCGYPAPTPRMQYTASSFAEPLTSLFRPVLGTRQRAELPSSLFPRHASFSTETPDTARELLYAPLVLAVQDVAARWRGLQRGRLQLYVLYIAATLVVLLLWEF